ncbi:UNVERIFIED_CONTAM: Pectinesterase inhibitor 6 [Sesamum radiatum]|uniref:Pectinesterase inhibitor 6 n=1 Tax=Sesamum radiatum TaxID=300843 RepID=A0AAW2W1V6_SESRA
MARAQTATVTSETHAASHATAISASVPYRRSQAQPNTTLANGRGGVSVAIGEAKRVARYLATLKRNRNGSGRIRGRNRIAVSDCVECFQDTLDNLHRSLYVLRKLSARDFGSQVEDVATWVSAALTDEDTCLDGFDEETGKRVKPLINRVSNVTYMTSNALALINKLATAGPECLNNG